MLAHCAHHCTRASCVRSPFTPFGFAAKKYDNDVEGLRDAIKNGDAASVRKVGQQP